MGRERQRKAVGVVVVNSEVDVRSSVTEKVLKGG